jgi:hypothetical protein|tara:strand:- start:501 stop:824 length:324 start_codon:yes stop_codon:yes gene_type:complete
LLSSLNNGAIRTIKMKGKTMTTDKPQAPIVNLNGTSKDALMEQVGDARSAIDDALKALALATPHGRDYQTASEGAYALAAAQHRDRVAALTVVSDDLLKIAMDIGWQ